MNKLIIGIMLTAVLAGCSDKTEKGRFTVTGEIKNAPDGQVVLEELYFSQKPPIILDSTTMKNGRFTLSTSATEEGLYRIRTTNNNEGFLLINDNPDIRLTADVQKPGIDNMQINGAGNHSLRQLILHADSLQKLLGARYALLGEMKKNNTPASDSVFSFTNAEFNRYKNELTAFCFGYADTAKSPVVALFAATFAPVELSLFVDPLNRLKNRFPNHNGIAGTLTFIREQVAAVSAQQNQYNQQAVSVGSTAPELTMNDVNGKPFSLSSLRGKFVLIDFWASWCGPCRRENPNIVAAYNQYKDKNFTVLGVSLDDSRSAWLKAIADDRLPWTQISDLKNWSSAAVPLYGFDGIPYNVLIDPQGKVIATDLRGNLLQSKLAEVLK